MKVKEKQFIGDVVNHLNLITSLTEVNISFKVNILTEVEEVQFQTYTNIKELKQQYLLSVAEIPFTGVRDNMEQSGNSYVCVAIAYYKKLITDVEPMLPVIYEIVESIKKGNPG